MFTVQWKLFLTLLPAIFLELPITRKNAQINAQSLLEAVLNLCFVEPPLSHEKGVIIPCLPTRAIDWSDLLFRVSHNVKKKKTLIRIWKSSANNHV